MPISVAAFSGDTLDEVQRHRHPATRQSRLKLSGDQGSSRSSFLRVNIRGIGATGNTTIEPSVAIFVDGAYVPRAGAMVSSMLDIESVEILRGPRAHCSAETPASARFRFTPRCRSIDFSGQVTGEIGNGDRYKVNGYVNVPVSDNAAFRFAAQKQWFGGYWHNDLDGKQYGGTDDTVLRGSFRAETGPSSGSSEPIIRRSKVAASPTSTSTRTPSRRRGSAS